MFNLDPRLIDLLQLLNGEESINFARNNIVAFKDMSDEEFEIYMILARLKYINTENMICYTYLADLMKP